MYLAYIHFIVNVIQINGQYYCEPCDTYTNTYDVMQAHLSGKSHKKKTKQINRFACDLCLIEVSSQETLQTHYQGTVFNEIQLAYGSNMMNLNIQQTEIPLIIVLGMTHIKRAKVAEEAKKEAENPIKGNLNISIDSYILDIIRIHLEPYYID